MKKILIALIILGVAGTVLYKAAYPSIERVAFGISGEINVSRRLARNTRAPNTMCYLIVKNQGDVPVAIKRYVNPVFPLHYEITAKDLMLADAWKEPLKVEVRINNHGQVGELQAGDMFSLQSTTVQLHAIGVNMTVDKMLGVPTLMAGATPDKGNFIFTSAAR
jgi:hypothetical protein